MEARHACNPTTTVCGGLLRWFAEVGTPCCQGSLLIGRPLLHLGRCTRQPP